MGIERSKMVDQLCLPALCLPPAPSASPSASLLPEPSLKSPVMDPLRTVTSLESRIESIFKINLGLPSLGLGLPVIPALMPQQQQQQQQTQAPLPPPPLPPPLPPSPTTMAATSRLDNESLIQIKQKSMDLIVNELKQVIRSDLSKKFYEQNNFKLIDDWHTLNQSHAHNKPISLSSSFPGVTASSQFNNNNKGTKPHSFNIKYHNQQKRPITPPSPSATAAPPHQISTRLPWQPKKLNAQNQNPHLLNH